MIEELAGTGFPASFTDEDVLLIGTGRRVATEAQSGELGELAGSQRRDATAGRR